MTAPSVIDIALARRSKHEAEIARLHAEILDLEGEVQKLGLLIDWVKELTDEGELPFPPEWEPPVPTEPSAEPSPPLHFSDHPAGGENEVVPQTRGQNPLPDASVVPDDARPAEAKTSAEDALSSASGGEAREVPAPATPSPKPGKPLTLTDRIRAMHAQHPAWTSRMIADALGAKAKSVSVILASVRKRALPPDEPQTFKSRADMIAHYSAVGKRLRGTS